MGALGWVSLVVASLCSPSVASACSSRPDAGVPSCVERTWTTLPDAGAVDVPTNPVFSLSFGSPSPYVERAPIVRRASDAARVELARGPSGMLAAEAELNPDTEYVIYDVGDPASCGETDPSVEVEVARFTTGAGPDLSPPAPPVVHGVSECHVNVCESSACCGPYSLTSWRLDYEASPDDDVIGYRTPEGGVVPFRYGEWVASGGYPLEVGRASGSSHLRIVAIDHAGNVSEATAPIDASRCAPPTPDGGVEAGMDAGPSTTPSGCGCSAAGTTAGEAAAIVGLLALCLVIAARRRVTRR